MYTLPWFNSPMLTQLDVNSRFGVMNLTVACEGQITLWCFVFFSMKTFCQGY